MNLSGAMVQISSKCGLILLLTVVVLVSISARSSVMDPNWSVLGYFSDMQPNESVIVATVVSIENCEIGRWPGPTIESPAFVLDVEMTLHGTPEVDLPVLGTNTFVFNYTCWHMLTKPRLPWILPGDRVLLRLEHLKDRKASWIRYVFFLPSGAIADTTILQKIYRSSMDWNSVDKCDSNTTYNDCLEAVQRTFAESGYRLGDIQAVLQGAGGE